MRWIKMNEIFTFFSVTFPANRRRPYLFANGTLHYGVAKIVLKAKLISVFVLTFSVLYFLNNLPYKYLFSMFIRRFCYISFIWLISMLKLIRILHCHLTTVFPIECIFWSVARWKYLEQKPANHRTVLCTWHDTNKRR